MSGSLRGSICAALICFTGSAVTAQSGLRDSLDRLDTNGNGLIEPNEVTPLARPYLERITRARRMSLDRPNPIDKLQEAARIYFALQNGVSRREVELGTQSGTVLPFGPDPGEPLVPDFGLAEIKYPYTEADLSEADRTLRRSDRNRDGFIDRQEARRADWTHRDPFEEDVDNDGRLSRLELGQRYARRRLLSGESDELIQKARRAGNDIRPSQPEQERRRDASQWFRMRGTGYRLTSDILGRFDLNKNGRLESHEVLTLGLPTTQIDVNLDGELSRDELHAFLTEIQTELGSEAEGIPGWFYELDVDEDGQVSMMEFTSEWSDERLQEFTSLDQNEDGLLTATEVSLSKAMVGGAYKNTTAEPLPPGRTIISEIEVTEDFLIGDLNLQLSITHSSVSSLDAFLTGPDGQRIELFTEIGGGDDNFDNTIFDDQSRYPVTKARPPYRGTFLPEGVAKRQPGLSAFNGKNIQGVWQLVIRGTRNERFGMLHNWSLIVRPMEELIGGVAPPPDNDGMTGEVSQMGSTLNALNRYPNAVPERNRNDSTRQNRIDYESVGRRFEQAVQSGKMTREQVNQAWREIKTQANGADRSLKELLGK
ncbi:EF hand [Planctomycetes bacterium CA13]|uniref:EF hand n=1 Tax=Novipirellula herctigrandis TaxID=2527986 RepID=A0A5C5ZCH0_9BACT|nr:EF hand [Planctomycetes bacterium CA13]